MRNDYDNFFTTLDNARPFFKFAAQGPAGAGKTHTTARIVGGLHKDIGSTKPVVIFDTEQSSKFLKPFFEKYGIKVLVRTSRSLSDLVDTMDYCKAGNSDILMIDSITHVWENFTKAYQKTRGNKTFISFDDWGIIKPIWKERFADRVVNDCYHILFTGRQGDVYEEGVDDEGKKKLAKVGVKMLTEKNTPYEPDILVMMEQVMDMTSDPVKISRRAIILKDRSTLLDGKTFTNPGYKDFKPVVDYLRQSATAPQNQSPAGDDQHLIPEQNAKNDNKQKAAIWFERCKNLLDKHCGGQKKEDKQRRLELVEAAFHGETSETAIEAMSPDQLESAFNTLKEKLEPTATTNLTPNPLARIKTMRDALLGVMTDKEKAEYSDESLEQYTVAGLATVDIALKTIHRERLGK